MRWKAAQDAVEAAVGMAKLGEKVEGVVGLSCLLLQYVIEAWEALNHKLAYCLAHHKLQAVQQTSYCCHLPARGDTLATRTGQGSVIRGSLGLVRQVQAASSLLCWLGLCVSCLLLHRALRWVARQVVIGSL